MAKVTIKEMREEIYRIKSEIRTNLDFQTQMAIMKRREELMLHTRVNVTKGGAVRYYLTSNASYKEVDDYLTQLINATYDILGYCF